MKFHWTNLMKSPYAELFEDFRNKNVFDLLGYEDDVYEELVKEFYANMHILLSGNAVQGTVIETRVKNKRIVINEDKLCRWFGMSKNGVRPTCSNDDKSMRRRPNPDDSDDEPEPVPEWTFELEEGIRRLRQLMVVPSDKVMEAMDLPVPYRLLHYAINRNIFPKKATNNHITNLDVEIIWHLEEGRAINFPHLILRMMKRKHVLLHAEIFNKSSKPKGMPYATLITKILRENNVSLEGETFVPHPHNWRVTTMNLKTMRLVKTVERGWMYAPHASHYHLTPANEGESFADAPPRMSSARQSNVGAQDLHSIRQEIGEVRQEMTQMRTEFRAEISAMGKLIEKVSSVVDKIWEKLTCRTDDVA